MTEDALRHICLGMAVGSFVGAALAPDRIPRLQWLGFAFFVLALVFA